MLTKNRKKEVIKELEEKAKNSKAVVFADYSGLTVNDLNSLRGQLREHEADFKVAKKTLVNLAFKNAGLKNVETKNLAGQMGIAFGMSDEVAPAKVLNKFAKTNPNLKILGGVLEGVFIAADQVLALAKLPSREELLAKVVGSLAAPMSGLLNVFQGNTRNLVYALNAIKEKKS